MEEKTPLTLKAAHQLGRLLHSVVQAPIIVGNKIIKEADDLIEAYGDKKIDEHLNEVERLAMQNSLYAEIEARRHVEGNDNIIMLDDNLTWEDWEVQHNIRASVKTDPIALPLYRYFRSRPIGRIKASIIHAAQRLNRGWDDTATWSLDTHLCRTLGPQLKHLAATTHGWPQSDKYPTFEDWQKALNEHGDILIAYGNKWEAEDFSYLQEKKQLAAAQKSLRWVAENLGGLWD